MARVDLTQSWLQPPTLPAAIATGPKATVTPTLACSCWRHSRTSRVQPREPSDASRFIQNIPTPARLESQLARALLTQ